MTCWSAAPLPEPVDVLPSLPDPFDDSASLTDRARAYLHTNCAQCHQPGGPTSVDIDLRYTTLLSNTNACAEPPQASDVGLKASSAEKLDGPLGGFPILPRIGALSKDRATIRRLPVSIVCRPSWTLRTSPGAKASVNRPAT